MMKKNYERQKFLSQEKGFLCICDLCKNEDIFGHEILGKFQKLWVKNADLISDFFNENILENDFDWIEKVLSCTMELCYFAMNRKAPKVFICNILTTAIR